MWLNERQVEPGDVIVSIVSKLTKNEGPKKRKRQKNFSWIESMAQEVDKPLYNRLQQYLPDKIDQS